MDHRKLAHRVVLGLLAAALIPACGGEDGDTGRAGADGAPGSPGSADAWSRLGNAGTVDGTNFAGTTDDVPFTIRANDLQIARFEPHATSPNVIHGHNGNNVTPGAHGAFIGGGGQGLFEVNRVTDSFGTVAGGRNNQAGDAAGTTTDAAFATVGGGQANKASGNASTVGGGGNNWAISSSSTICGGNANLASGIRATVVGGDSNVASGDYSLAAGTMAVAAHTGAFVWQDNTAGIDTLSSTAAHQFSARASGGVRFYSAAAPNLTAGVELAPGGNAWGVISDRDAKTNFSAVDVKDVLERLSKVPVTTWNLKTQEARIRHIGPMAQDFRKAFEVGESERHITTSDADGVAFAAIQGLYAMVKEKDAKIAALEARLQALEGRLSDR